MHTHVRTHTYAHAQARTCTQIHAHTYALLYVYTYTRIRRQTHAHTHLERTGRPPKNGHRNARKRAAFQIEGVQRHGIGVVGACGVKYGPKVACGLHHSEVGVLVADEGTVLACAHIHTRWSMGLNQRAFALWNPPQQSRRPCG